MPDFETVAESMQRAADECDRTGRTEAGLLWRDALHYLMAQRAEIERLRTALRDMRDRAEAAEEDAMPGDLVRELASLRHENGDRGNQIINLRRELADMSVIRGIDDRYGGLLAFMLECVIVDYHGHWDAACKLLDEYKAAWDAVDPQPPTFMGEPISRRNRAEIAQKLRALPKFEERSE